MLAKFDTHEWVHLPSSEVATNQHLFNNLPLPPHAVRDQTFDPFASLRTSQATRPAGASQRKQQKLLGFAEHALNDDLQKRKAAGAAADKEKRQRQAAETAVEQERRRCAAAEQAS